MSVISQQQYDQAVDLLSKEVYDKALKIIMQRHKYNQQYYQKRKLQHQQEKNETKKTGRKPLEEISQERALHTLQKYKLKCQRHKKEETVEELKATINQLFKKLKEKMP